MKKGDTVRLKSNRRSKLEGLENWIKREPTKPKIGDQFTLASDIDEDGWVDINELRYAHPAQKFELI